MSCLVLSCLVWTRQKKTEELWRYMKTQQKLCNFLVQLVINAHMYASECHDLPQMCMTLRMHCFVPTFGRIANFCGGGLERNFQINMAEAKQPCSLSPGLWMSWEGPGVEPGVLHSLSVPFLWGVAALLTASLTRSGCRVGLVQLALCAPPTRLVTDNSGRENSTENGVVWGYVCVWGRKRGSQKFPG